LERQFFAHGVKLHYSQQILDSTKVEAKKEFYSEQRNALSDYFSSFISPQINYPQKQENNYFDFDQKKGTLDCV
jgi:hypothetical protein